MGARRIVVAGRPSRGGLVLHRGPRIPASGLASGRRQRLGVQPRLEDRGGRRAVDHRADGRRPVDAGARGARRSASTVESRSSCSSTGTSSDGTQRLRELAACMARAASAPRHRQRQAQHHDRGRPVLARRAPPPPSARRAAARRGPCRAAPPPGGPDRRSATPIRASPRSSPSDAARRAARSAIRRRPASSASRAGIAGERLRRPRRRSCRRPSPGCPCRPRRRRSPAPRSRAARAR